MREENFATSRVKNVKHFAFRESLISQKAQLVRFGEKKISRICQFIETKKPVKS